MDENKDLKHEGKEQNEQENLKPVKEGGVSSLVVGTIVVLGTGLVLSALLPSLSRTRGATRSAVLELQQRDHLVQQAIEQETATQTEKPDQEGEALPPLP